LTSLIIFGDGASDGPVVEGLRITGPIFLGSASLEVSFSVVLSSRHDGRVAKERDPI
jgi:hypothetical protein